MGRLVVALLVAGAAAETNTSGEWVLGGKGQSCSQTCDAHPGLVCVETALVDRHADIDSVEKAQSVFEKAGQKCKKCSLEDTFDPDSSPYLIDFGFLGIDCVAAPRSGGCTAFGRRDDEVRLCWCEYGTGPSPKPDPVPECTWHKDCKPVDCTGPRDMCLKVQGSDTGNSGCRVNHAYVRGTCETDEGLGACCYHGQGVNAVDNSAFQVQV